jgi:hypothetical protein
MSKTATRKSAFRARVIEFKHSSGLASSKILADEPGLYRLYARNAGRSESVMVSVAGRCEVLDRSPGSQVRFSSSWTGGSKSLVRNLLGALAGLRRRRIADEAMAETTAGRGTVCLGARLQAGE